MKRVIVAGSKGFDDYKLLKEKLDEILSRYKDVEIVSGHSIGADMLGEKYAEENGISCSVFPADWKKDWKRAGFARNTQMVEYASEDDPLVVAFWDGKSHGTMDTITKAKMRGIECIVINYESQSLISAAIMDEIEAK